MPKNLVIVESPAKAKTIEKYLGKDFVVKSSFGHIRDLPKKGLSIDKEHNFEPTYEVPADKKKVISELKKLAKGAEVWLASDEDREGEAIAWHLCEALKLDPKKTKRIVFHEITKPAILAAIEHPRTVDVDLVNAQQARRVLDRLVGYELSPVLWKKVQAGLSAGRVQSVAVKLIVEREREIADFTPEKSFKVTANFETKGKAALPSELTVKPKTAEEVHQLFGRLPSDSFSVTAIDQKPGQRSPGAPFTTSTLQQEASRRLGFSVKQTMSVAQKLYENGFITYMRTDSTNLSEIALSAINGYVTSAFGAKYAQTRRFKTKQSGAQEAHEAIRPTDPARTSVPGERTAQKLYELIRGRAIASQMAPAQIEKTEVTITGATHKDTFLAKGEVLLFDGFLKVYGSTKDDVILPEIASGEAVTLQAASGVETFSRGSARFSEATLVKQLEEMGIGRPSTYAPTISTIQDRGYVEKRDLEGEERQVLTISLKGGTISEQTDTVITGADRAKLMPTHLGIMVTDFLSKYFDSVIDYDFTARVEEEFDSIAEGKVAWPKMIGDFYKDFTPLIKKSDSATKQEASQMRELGVDPKTKRTVYARYGRYGPMLQQGESSDEEKPLFAPMPPDTTLETVTFEQALPMFNLPRVVGKTTEGEEIKANIGRFGPYIQIGKSYVSIKPLSALTITEAEARDIIANKGTTNGKTVVKEFPKSTVKVLIGPYGPYITDGKKNARIPKDTEPADVTLEAAKDLLAKAPAKGAKRGFKRRRKSAK